MKYHYTESKREFDRNEPSVITPQRFLEKFQASYVVLAETVQTTLTSPLEKYQISFISKDILKLVLVHFIHSQLVRIVVVRFKSEKQSDTYLLNDEEMDDLNASEANKT